MRKTTNYTESAFVWEGHLVNRFLFFVLFLYIFGLGNTIAQSPTAKDIAQITWGGELKEPSGSILTKIISSTDDGFYALRRKDPNGFMAGDEQRIILEYYDERMRLKKAK